MEIDNLINIENFNNLDVNDNAFMKECIKISNDVRNSKATIVQLVERLETLLTDKQPEKRQLGTYILSFVLNALPKDFLYPNQLTFISMFYVDRLKDHHKVIPAVIRGLLFLVDCNLADGQISKIFNALFQNVSCQQQDQKDRYNIYRIFEISWNKYRTELKLMHFDFICGMLTFIDGERDPRNLLFLFNWLPTFVKDIELGHLTEEMFEVMSCYFPVSFKPSNKEELDISREDLANALSFCLTAIPDFSEHCITLALDNLSASPKESKLDSLKLLEQGTKTFSTETYLRHNEILSDIQREIFTANEDIQSMCFSTLKSIIGLLSKASIELFKPTLQNIIDTIQGNLMPEKLLYVPSIKIVICLVESSTVSSEIVTKQIVPLLTNTYNLTKDQLQQAIILSNLVQLSVSYLRINELTDFKDGPEIIRVIPSLVLKAHNDPIEKTRFNAFNCLELLCPYLSIDTRLFLYNNLINVLSSEDISNAEFCVVVKCFKRFVEFYPDEVKSKIINRFEPKSINQIRKYFVVLAEIINFENFSNFVIEKLLHTCVGNCDKSYENLKIDASKIALDVLHGKILYIKDNNSLFTNFSGEILNWALNNSLIDAKNNWNYCENLCDILKFVSTYASYDDICNDLRKIIGNYEQTKNVALIFPINGLTTRSKRENKIPENLWNVILDIAKTTIGDGNLHLVSVKLIGNIINKTTEDFLLENYLKDIEETMRNDQSAFIQLAAFTLKGLIMKDHANKDIWMDKLINALNVNEQVAISFKYIMHDDYYEFSNDCFCIRKLLFRQKFFIKCCKVLINANKEDVNNNYLLAFGYLIEETPQNIIKLELSKIYTLILLSLDNLENANALWTILTNLIKLILDKDQIVEEHIYDFLKRFLKLSEFETSMKVRIAALQCLKHCSEKYPTYKLLPHKTEILYGLIKALDDKKRLVRKEAVEARSKWYLMDAPQ